jgi:hypothetical protein
MRTDRALMVNKAREEASRMPVTTEQEGVTEEMVVVMPTETLGAQHMA